MSAASEGADSFLEEGRRRRIVLRTDQAARLLKLALKGLPNEVCGFLAGVSETVEEIIPVTNAEPSPVCYLMHSAEQFRAMKIMRDKGLEMVGIYHSHPVSPAYPSARDVERAAYPDCVYLIIGIGRDETEMRGFRIEDRAVAEVEVVVQDPVE